MILAWDNSWAILTPTKTGTYSLEGTLVEKLDVGVKLKPRHRMDWIFQPETQRIMIVRDPIERWCSIRWAIHRWTQNGSKPYLWQFALGSTNDFATEYFRRRREQPYPMYTANNYENFQVCTPHHVFHTERLSEVMTYLGYDPVHLKHLNHTRDRTSAEDTLKHLSQENLDALMAWVKPDMEAFDYE